MDEATRYVDISYKINCVSHIDSVTSTFYIDIKLFYHWIDKKFIGRKRNAAVDIKTEGSWNPDIIVTNEHRLMTVEEHREVRVNDPATGEIKSSIQYRGTLFINNMDLSSFPVDCQNLQICLKPYKLEAGKVYLRPRREESAIEHQDSHEWKVLGHFMKAFETDKEASSTKKSYSTMYITVLVQRQSGWFVSNVFLLIGLLLTYSWFTFLMPPEEIQGKLDLTNTALVASIAHKFVVGGELPKVPYRTLLDWYVDFCFLLQFMVVLSIFAVKHVENYHLALHEDGNAHLAGEEVVTPWTLNWILLAANMVLWLLLVGWVRLKLHFVRSDVDHWLSMAEHINAGKSDDVSVSVKALQRVTNAPSNGVWGFWNRRANKKDTFFQFEDPKADYSEGDSLLETTETSRTVSPVKGSTKYDSI